jgi:serine protease Do
MSSRACTVVILSGVLAAMSHSSHLNAADTRSPVIKPVPETVDDLRNLEKQVQDVVTRVAPTTVGLRMGASQQGSGVLIKDGYVLTAGHVSGMPGGAAAIILPDGRTLNGKALGRNTGIDSGLIRITDKGNWPVAETGKSADLKIGQWVIAIGHPGGIRSNRTPVVRLGRILLANAFVIRTDCPIVSGDSGGPLFDLDGKLVGIHSRIGGSISENLHVPVDCYINSWARLTQGESWGGILGSALVTPSRGGDIVFEKEDRLTTADPKDKKRTESHYKEYEFKMVPGCDYTLDMTGGDPSKPFDPFLRLEDSVGNKLAEDDDGGGSQNARIVFRPVKEDTYRIIVTTCDPNQTGAYKLAIRQLDLRDRIVGDTVEVLPVFKMPEDIAPLLLDKMNKAGRHLFVSVTLFDSKISPVARKEVTYFWKAGKSRILTDDWGVARLALSGANARELMVKASKGNRILVELTDSVGIPQPLPLGEETLDKDRLGSAGGMIVLEAWNRLAASDPVDNVRPGCRHQAHLFKLTAGASYAIDLESTAFDAFLRLEDLAGKQLAQDDDSAGNLNSRIEYRALSDISIRIIVTTAEMGHTGVYRLTVRQEGESEFLELAARTACERKPKDAQAHFNLGKILRSRGNLEGAIASFRKAVELDTRNGLFHSHLGQALNSKGDLEGASTAYRKVIELVPKEAEAHSALGQALMLQARFAEARDAFRSAFALYPLNNPAGAQQAGQNARDCERLLRMENHLPDLLEGRQQPKDSAERLLLAQFSRSKRMFAQSTRLMAAAFAEDAKLADDVNAGHRYVAARHAALAVAGQGEDAQKITVEESTRLRKLALEWLRADLTFWSRLLESGNSIDRTKAAAMIRGWKQDRDLAGLREAEALKRLPASEQEAFLNLWTEVETLLNKSAPATSAPVQSLPAADSRNSPQIVKALRRVVAAPSKSTVRVRCNGKDAALGTIVAADGWVVTKSSELDGKITCLFANGKEFTAAIKGTHEPYDLALLKIDANELTPVVLGNSKAATVGRWVASVGTDTEPVAIGVVGVATRRLEPGDQPPKFLYGGYLGIHLAPSETSAKISRIDKGSPAEAAGLKIGDVVVKAGDEKTPDAASYLDAANRHNFGDEIILTINRDMETIEIKARFTRRPDDQLLAIPQERMGSTLSNRRGGFPFMLQHDGVLKDTDCGGPLVDLDSNVVGINIARVGRVESYAIPAEAVRLLLPKLMPGGLAPPVEK